MKGQMRRQDIVQPELSYKIVGCAYEVYNELGFGHAEKIYQKALGLAFKNAGLSFKEQVFTPLKFKDEVIGKQYFDFLIEGIVIVEIKKNAYFSKANIDQVNQYLTSSNLELAILINFTAKEVVYKRLVNINKPKSLNN
jgi:GxxExxY protein